MEQDQPMLPPLDASAYEHDSIDIAAPPGTIYGMVSAIERMGEWSPEAVGGRWLDGGSGQVGDWFEGDNATPDRQWQRRCQVATADPGRDFTFVVGGVEANCTWWSYELVEIPGGTRVTERWWFVNKTEAMAAATPEQVTARVVKSRVMLTRTLAALKEAAEAASS